MQAPTKGSVARDHGIDIDESFFLSTDGRQRQTNGRTCEKAAAANGKARATAMNFMVVSLDGLGREGVGVALLLCRISQRRGLTCVSSMFKNIGALHLASTTISNKSRCHVRIPARRAIFFSKTTMPSQVLRNKAMKTTTETAMK
jgi:hypothetical protein